MCTFPRQNGSHAGVVCVPFLDKMGLMQGWCVYLSKTKWVSCRGGVCTFPRQNGSHAGVVCVPFLDKMGPMQGWCVCLS